MSTSRTNLVGAICAFFTSARKPRARRRRQLGVEALHGAIYRTLCVESLEPKCLMTTLFAPAAIVGTAIAGNAAAQQPTVQIGNLQAQSQAISIDDVRGSVLVGNSIHVVGNEAGLGVRQIIDVTTGTVSAMEAFTSLAGVSGGNSNTTLYGISVLNDGRIIYVGASATAATPNSPTYWFAPDQPIAGARFASDTGEILAVTPSGLLAGGIHAAPSVGNLTTPQFELPTSGGLTNVDASADDAYIVGGAGIYRRVNVGELNYELIDISGVDLPEDAISAPDIWHRIERYNSSYIVFANYLTESFSSNVMGIDPISMDTVFVGNNGDSLVDARTYGSGSVTIVMVQGINGPAIYTSSDGFTTRVELESAFGVGVDVVALGAMNDQGLGFIANVNGEARAVSFGLTISPVEQVIQVTSRIHEGLYPVGYIGTGRGGRTFETVLYGSNDFDATKIDRRSLFVGDTANSTSARIITVTYRDGKRDAVLIVDKRTAFSPVIEDTTRTLGVTGKLTTGKSFDASSAVTVTNQTWWQVWADDEGPRWIYSFLRNLRRGWWF